MANWDGSILLASDIGSSDAFRPEYCRVGCLVLDRVNETKKTPHAPAASGRRLLMMGASVSVFA